MRIPIAFLIVLIPVYAFGADGAALERDAKAFMEKGDLESAVRTFEEAIAEYMARDARQEAAAAAITAFLSLAGSAKPELGAQFLPTALDAAKGESFPKLKARFETDFASALAALKKKGAFAPGARLIEGAIEGLRSKKAFCDGLSEGHLRRCLDVFLVGAAEFAKAVENAEALCSLGKREKYQYWENAGLLCAGKAHCLAGQLDKSVQALEAAIKSARSGGDTICEAAAFLWSGRAYCEKGNYDAALKAAASAEKFFRSIRDRAGEMDVRNLRMRIARASGDEATVRRLQENMSVEGGEGGAGGSLDVDADAVEFCRKVGEMDKETPVIQISVKGNRLVFKNLLNSKETAVQIEFKYHYESVFGVHFALRGPEVQFLKFAPNEGLPGIPGGSVTIGEWDIIISQPDFDPFRPRHFPSKGGVILLSNSGQLHWVRR